jgi:hypothetical protein
MTLVAREEVRGAVRPHSSETLFGALSEVFAAGQQVVLDRIAMLQAEVTSDVRKLAVGGGLVAGAGVVGLLGYAVLNAALAALLTRWLPLDASLGIVGLFNVLLGGIALKLGLDKMSKPSAFDRPLPEKEDTHG